jgi:RND superfamily putative drug exporter
LPALDLRTGTPGADDLPADNPVVQAYDRLQEAFPGGPAPARVVISVRRRRLPGVDGGRQ